MKKAGLIIATLLVSNVALAQYDVLDDELASPPAIPEALPDLSSKNAAPAIPHPMMPADHPMMKRDMATTSALPTIPAATPPAMPANHPTLQPQQMVPPALHPVMPASHPMMPANHPTLQDMKEMGMPSMPEKK